MTQQTAANDATRRRIAESFARQGLMQHFGARLGYIGHGEVHIHLPISPNVTQQHGYFHGGATGAIADSAGGYAALTMLDHGSEVLTVEYKINLIAPAAGEELKAIGTVVKAGRILTVCRLDVYAQSGNEQKHIATGQQTLIRADAG
ncbi:PaaI family thioesterase [Glaciibacter sp. 2TAF33]|uniref:PaaI family thioesterase n=1 Tax=Glaciibacter sp. 2TAF33 TaxID=3233015 RepID=UPI003F9084A6